MKIDNKTFKILIDSIKDYFEFLKRLEKYNSKIIINEPNWEKDYIKTDTQKWANAIFNYYPEYIDESYDLMNSPEATVEGFLDEIGELEGISELTYPGVGKWKISDTPNEEIDFKSSEGVKFY